MPSYAPEAIQKLSNIKYCFYKCSHLGTFCRAPLPSASRSALFVGRGGICAVYRRPHYSSCFTFCNLPNVFPWWHLHHNYRVSSPHTTRLDGVQRPSTLHLICAYISVRATVFLCGVHRWPAFGNKIVLLSGKDADLLRASTLLQIELN